MDAHDKQSIDLKHPDFFRNPYPFYAQMRTLGQPVWLPHQQDSLSEGVLLFSRYDDAIEIFRQTSALSKNIRSVRPPGAASAFDLHMLHRDGEDHLRLRRLVSDYFSPQAIQRLRPAMTEMADSLLAPLAHRESFDIMAEFAERMPLLMTARLIGLPPEDMAQVRAWSLLLGEGFDSLLATPDVLARQKQALSELMAYVGHLMQTGKGRADVSLLSFLVAACEAGQLAPDELAAMIGFLLFAGHETTINLIGNGLWLLLSHPEQWHMLREDPSLMADAVEEILRFESPEQRTSFRLTNEALDINGVIVEPGRQIGVIIGSANRDEAAFRNPDVFDIRRTPNRHLAFGLGLHQCLGKTLARVEANIALTRVLHHFPSLRLRQDEPRWRRNSFFRGLDELIVAG